MRKFWLGTMMFLALVMSACDNSAAPELPTLFPTDTPAPVVPTEVPSITFTPTALRQQSLPPTWTFTPEPSNTPEPPTPTEIVATIEGLSPACEAFGPDRAQNRRDFPLGTAPQVYWLPVAGAASYQVSLFNEFGAEIHTAYVAETTYTFPAELFEAGKAYGWEVYPRDDRAIQMCYGRGDELVPFTQP